MIEIDDTDSASIQAATGASQTVEDATFRSRIRNFYNRNIRGKIYMLVVMTVYIAGIATGIIIETIRYSSKNHDEIN